MNALRNEIPCERLLSLVSQNDIFCNALGRRSHHYIPTYRNKSVEKYQASLSDVEVTQVLKVTNPKKWECEKQSVLTTNCFWFSCFSSSSMTIDHFVRTLPFYGTYTFRVYAASGETQL